MKTTVMFIDNAQPLVGVPVRLAGDEERTSHTDQEGKVEIDLMTGTHTFEIYVEGEWLSRQVERKGKSSLFIVDIRRDFGEDMSTLNTLQINLSSLVGDRYVFETVLGRGGMGVVVKAIDRLLNRPVAIKMLSDELQDNEEAQQIFLVEARNLATLSHPNLVAIHDILNIDGRVLMVFEYVLGENLEDKVAREGGLDEVEALRLAIQLTRCVSYLHEHELIHRDLKPSNIIIQGDGTLKLIDFGLARSLNELYIRGTRVRGTPAYMAPEQVQGIHLTVQTDIYQVGISLYETLAGTLPFKTGDMAYAHVHRDPPPLLELRPDLDPDLAALVHACLRKKPSERPADARVVLDRLSAIYSRLINDDGSGLGLAEVTGSFSEVSSDSFDQVDVHFDSFEDGDIDIPDVESEPEISALPAEDEANARGWLIGGIGLLIVVLAVFVGFGYLESDDGPDISAQPGVSPVEEQIPAAVVAPQNSEAVEAPSEAEMAIRDQPDAREQEDPSEVSDSTQDPGGALNQAGSGGLEPPVEPVAPPVKRPPPTQATARKAAPSQAAPSPPKESAPAADAPSEPEPLPSVDVPEEPVKTIASPTERKRSAPAKDPDKAGSDEVKLIEIGEGESSGGTLLPVGD